MTPTLGPMSDRARTTLAGRIARISMGIDNYEHAPKVIINGEAVDTTEVNRRVAEHRKELAILLDEDKNRPWENRGQEQSDAAAAEGS